MLKLPNISSKVSIRPGTYRSNTKIFIPSEEHKSFWDDFYLKLKNSKEITFPINKGENKINLFFGYFGYRWHPINFTPKYFHIGIDVMEEVGYKVKNIAKGELEYCGFAEVNGLYIMIKHPHITTHDGFTLYSIYMHLKNSFVGFNLLQKIGRELPIKDFIKLQINNGLVIGTVGDTGNPLINVPHLHFQLEFRNENKKCKIAIDPMQAFGFATKKNLTADIETEQEFKIFYNNNQTELNPWLKFWHNKL
jgi:murein DD-endopeptidase MepM/ murein hydrolase activator NlpD